VIQSFGDRATAALFDGQGGTKIRRIPADLRGAAVRKLDMLNAAAALMDLRSPPGNRLELLQGDHAGRHSIRINQQWRVIFRWTDAGPTDVSIVDYH